MKKTVMYYHGGSGNHGCEAIVRSTNKILGRMLTLFSSDISEDEAYGIQQIVSLSEDREENIAKKSLSNIFAAIMHKLRKDDYVYICLSHKHFFDQVESGDVYLSIGGDNYCYNGRDRLWYYNKRLHSKGARTVLWGCSIEPEALAEAVIKDLKAYDLITVRESLTFEALYKVGIRDNVVLCADPAFQLDMESVQLPAGFTKENTIGINVSPLAAEAGNLVIENYMQIVSYILDNTNDKILLIPHVVKPGSDDRQVLAQINQRYKESNRIVLLEDCNCMKLKGYISQCKRFVGARTHATIAAYSTCVPTLVAGYSIKARGIAKDLFGTDENYVVSVQKFQTDVDLLNAYRWIEKNDDIIRDHLQRIMPEYKQKAQLAVTALEKIRG